MRSRYIIFQSANIVYIALICFTFFNLSAMAISSALRTLNLSASEHIIFFGDSLTEMGDYKGGYVDLIRSALKKRYPDKTLLIEGAGVSGDEVSDLLERVQSDIISKQPSIVVVFIGINDVWGFHGYLGTSIEDFQSRLEKLLNVLDKAGIKVAISTLSVIGEKRSGNSLDVKLDEYSQLIREISKERSLPLVDLRSSFKTYLQAHNTSDRSSGILTSDEVHLNAQGNQLVACKMLELFGVGNNDCSRFI